MKKILIFNDISGLGNCSMSANLPVFSALGHYCMPVITSAYSCQTGFGDFHCFANDKAGVFAKDIIAQWTPDAVYSGYCHNSDVVRQISEAKGALPLFVDPVMGDNGKLYPVFDDDYVQQMKKLVRGAFCITPNLTEACLLAVEDYSRLQKHFNAPGFLGLCGKIFADFTRKTGCGSAVITGIPCGELIGNVVLQGNEPAAFVTNDRVNVNYSGTGDVFSSVLLGTMLKGYGIVEATQIAANFVGKAAEQTQRERRFGVDFSKVLHLLFRL